LKPRPCRVVFELDLRSPIANGLFLSPREGFPPPWLYPAPQLTLLPTAPRSSLQTAMNPINTVFDAKRLIGRKFSDSQVQAGVYTRPLLSST